MNENELAKQLADRFTNKQIFVLMLIKLTKIEELLNDKPAVATERTEP